MNHPSTLASTPARNSQVFGLTLRIYWEDTDAGGIVFYANYLKYFERARTEWLRALGLEQHALRQQTGGMFVVSEANIKYLRPARLDDQLWVTASVADMGRSSLTMQQQAQIWHPVAEPGATAAPPTVLCTGQVRIGWVDSQSLKPARIPPFVLEALQP